MDKKTIVFDFDGVIVSTRCARPEGMGAVRRYLRDNHIVVDDVVAHKPPAMKKSGILLDSIIYI